MFNINAITENLEAAGFSVFNGGEIEGKTMMKAIYVSTGHSFDIVLDHREKSYEIQGDQRIDLANNPQDVERLSIIDKISRAIWGF